MDMSEDRKECHICKNFNKCNERVKYQSICCKKHKKYKEETNKNSVLNMLKEKDKEIEKYKYLYEKALDDVVSSNKENIELKKQIDLMAEYIATLDIEEDICKNIKNDNCDKMNFGECEYCIKQYFENKAKGE